MDKDLANCLAAIDPEKIKALVDYILPENMSNFENVNTAMTARIAAIVSRENIPALINGIV